MAKESKNGSDIEPAEAGHGAAQGMRKHTVAVDLTYLELVKARPALRLPLEANSNELGELQIGRRSLFWMGGSRRKAKRIDWTRSASLIHQLTCGG